MEPRPIQTVGKEQSSSFQASKIDWATTGGWRYPAAFSLVELLVVIAILVLVMGLAIPAISKSIEAADRNQCGSKQAKLALAMASYDARQGFFPGIRNSLPIKSPDGRGILRLVAGGAFLTPGYFPMPDSNANWFIMLLPHIGFTDIFNQTVDGKIWVGYGGALGTAPEGNVTVEVSSCPSRVDHYNISNGHNNMHYKANASPASFNPNDGAIGDNANGIFVGLASVVAGDGASTTLLIAEGPRDSWFPNTWDDSGPLPNPATTGPMAGKTSCGTFIGVRGDNASPARPRHVHPSLGANMLFGFGPAPTATTRIVNTFNAVSYYPGSADGSFANQGNGVHPGGANVAFVDGSWRFLNENLAPHVYGHLLTHRSVWSDNGTPSLLDDLYSTNSAAANAFLKCPPASQPYALKPGDY